MGDQRRAGRGRLVSDPWEERDRERARQEAERRERAADAGYREWLRGGNMDAQFDAWERAYYDE